MPPRTESYRSWLIGELTLIAVLGAATLLFVATSELEGYALPEVRLALDTAVAVMAAIVAILTAIRFLVEGRAMDLLLTGGFVAAALGTFVFSVAPRFGGAPVRPEEAWAAMAAQLLSAALIAVAPFVESARAATGARSSSLTRAASSACSPPSGSVIVTIGVDGQATAYR